jgi:putative DNA primase/helicase
MAAAMEAHGLGVHDPICDGDIHRFQIPSDSYGKLNGWYASRGDGGYAFGNWSTGLKITKRKGRMTSSERLVMKERIKQSAADKLVAQAEAKRTAQDAWAMAKPVVEHPYLSAKGIESYGLRTMNNLLLVPMYFDDELVNLQRIWPDAKKRFLYGGRVSGCYGVMSEVVDQVVICEGMATAASLHALASDPVVMAFTADNLMAVVLQIRDAYPDMKIILAADNDWETLQRKGVNPGLVKGLAAAEAVDAKMIYPAFTSEDVGMSDFNDYLQAGRSMDDVVIGTLTPPSAAAGRRTSKILPTAPGDHS